MIALSHIINACNACGALPPGFDKLSHGIDFAKFEIFLEGITTEAWFAGISFDFTCDQIKTWTNPALKYDLPDQIESITALPGGILNHKVVVTNNYH